MSVIGFYEDGASIYEAGEGKWKGKMVTPFLHWAMYHAARLITVYSPNIQEIEKKKQSEGKHDNVVISYIGKELMSPLSFTSKRRIL